LHSSENQCLEFRNSELIGKWQLQVSLCWGTWDYQRARIFAAMSRRISGCVSVLVWLQFLAIAQQADKSNFTGTWIFNPHTSSLEIPPPSASTFHIKHDEPNFHLSRTHVFNGKSDTWEIDLVTDGKHEVIERNSHYTARTRIYWEGRSLVLDMKMETKNGESASNLVKYSLADDGNTLIALERYSTEKHLNKWVFDKKVP
jgi:hypothetical protein